MRLRIVTVESSPVQTSDALLEVLHRAQAVMKEMVSLHGNDYGQLELTIQTTFKQQHSLVSPYHLNIAVAGASVKF
jgi:glucokinase